MPPDAELRIPNNIDHPVGWEGGWEREYTTASELECSSLSGLYLRRCERLTELIRNRIRNPLNQALAANSSLES